MRAVSTPAGAACSREITVGGIQRSLHHRPRPHRLECDEGAACLRPEPRVDLRWSPEQISHALSEQFPGQPARQLVPESIYRAFYAQFPVLERSLRTRRWRRQRRRSEARRALALPMTDDRARRRRGVISSGRWRGSRGDIWHGGISGEDQRRPIVVSDGVGHHDVDRAGPGGRADLRQRVPVRQLIPGRRDRHQPRRRSHQPAPPPPRRRRLAPLGMQQDARGGCGLPCRYRCLAGGGASTVIGASVVSASGEGVVRAATARLVPSPSA